MRGLAGGILLARRLLVLVLELHCWGVYTADRPINRQPVARPSIAHSGGAYVYACIIANQITQQ